MTKPVNVSADRTPRPSGPVDKALDVLSALVRPGSPHRLADLAHDTGLAKPTAHRLLRAMTEAGFAEAAAGGSYRAGPRLLGVAAAALADSEEVNAVRPVLADLRQRTGQTALFALRHGTEALYVEKAEPEAGYRMAVHVGSHVPLHCTAVGRAILTRLPDDEVEALLGTDPLPAHTPWTRTDPEAVRRAVAEADGLGYAVEHEEYERDVRALAAPVLGGDGHAVGALSLSGLTFTLDDDSVATFGPMLRAAAGQLSAVLGAGSGVGTGVAGGAGAGGGVAGGAGSGAPAVLGVVRGGHDD